ncbi:MAG: hypothetical protein AAGB23_02380 [Pseudomonadota bacterium]
MVNLGISTCMGESRIDKAVERIEAAVARMDEARVEVVAAAGANTGSGSAATTNAEPESAARVMELVNAHEKLREEVSDTLRDLDTLIEELEG